MAARRSLHNFRDIIVDIVMEHDVKEIFKK